ncbi:MAG TPA: hypothetical protein VFQ25_11550 [Ktedonobacterales bacterium]|nr:hypothetical protein [Ktedonobacterales bacterium]
MARSSGLDTPQHAITDVYDTESGAFLVRYPPALVIGLGIAGVIAFGMAGFLGYERNSIFAYPWPLYLWFSALLVTLLASIFRNRALRGHLIAVLIIAALSVVIVYVVHDPSLFGGTIRKLLQKYLPLLAKEQLTYVVINFAIIVIFWADTARRWARRAGGLRPHAVLDLTTGKKTDTADPEDLPSMSELVSGDLIAGAVLTGLLSIIFQRDAMAFITQTPLTVCSVSVSFPPSGCVDGQTATLASLTLIDQTQSLAYLAVGLIVLGVAATMGGFGSVGGAPMPVGVSRAVYAVLSDGNPPVTAPITTGVAETVLDTLRAAIDRRLRELVTGVARALRNIVWPALLFTATFGVYQLSVDVQQYLHGSKTLAHAGQYIVPAAEWGLLSVLTIVLSAALVVFKWRVVDNTMRFLGLIGLIVLLTFWIFSLALWGFNKLLEQFNADVVKPFDPPSVATAVSFGALVILGGILVIGRRGLSFMPRQAARSQPVTAARVQETTSPLPKTTQE